MENYDLGYSQDYTKKIIYIVIALIGILAISIYFLAKKDNNDRSVSPSVSPILFICGFSKVSDIDNNTYKTVKIGDQCWLKETLRVAQSPTGEWINRYCYNDNSSWCDLQGGLYDWNTAMNDSLVGGAQGICPNGWHIPRDSEWFILEKNLAGGTCVSTRTEAGCDPAGTELKEDSISDFQGILPGYRQGSDGSFTGQGEYAYFWSSLENGDSAWNRNLRSRIPSVFRNYADKKSGFSVRCLKN